MSLGICHWSLVGFFQCRGLMPNDWWLMTLQIAWVCSKICNSTIHQSQLTRRLPRSTLEDLFWRVVSCEWLLLEFFGEGCIFGFWRNVTGHSSLVIIRIFPMTIDWWLMTWQLAWICSKICNSTIYQSPLTRRSPRSTLEDWDVQVVAAVFTYTVPYLNRLAQH